LRSPLCSAASVSLPAGALNRTRRAPRWRLFVNVAVLAAFATAMVVRRGDLRRAVDGVSDVTLQWILALASLTVLRLFTQGWYTAAVTPGIGLTRGIAVHEVTTGANNTIVGSGLVSAGLRISMLRSWRISDSAIGITIVTLNVIAATLVWVVAAAAATTTLVATDGVVATAVSVGVIVAAVAVLGCSAGLWTVLLTAPQLSAWLACRADRALTVIRRRLPRLLPALDLTSSVERWRLEASQLVRTQRARLIGTALLNQAVVIATPLCVLRAFGITAGQVTLAEAFSAYGLVRLAAALSPLPGGIGVTEFGLATLLTRFGGDDTRVLTAVLVYRVLTFVVPIATGALAFMWWRRTTGLTARAIDRQSDEKRPENDRAADADQAHSAAQLIE
jgi:putative heme transporter